MGTMTLIETYRANAAAQRAAAEKTDLPNRREMHERSARTWEAMALSAEDTAEHGASSPMKRPGQPNEVAPCYVFLASEDASYITGQVLHPNGGTVVNG